MWGKIKDYFNKHHRIITIICVVICLALIISMLVTVFSMNKNNSKSDSSSSRDSSEIIVDDVADKIISNSLLTINDCSKSDKFSTLISINYEDYANNDAVNKGCIVYFTASSTDDKKVGVIGAEFDKPLSNVLAELVNSPISSEKIKLTTQKEFYKVINYDLDDNPIYKQKYGTPFCGSARTYAFYPEIRNIIDKDNCHEVSKTFIAMEMNDLIYSVFNFTIDLNEKKIVELPTNGLPYLSSQTNFSTDKDSLYYRVLHKLYSQN